jgi:hypothetical protein
MAKLHYIGPRLSTGEPERSLIFDGIPRAISTTDDLTKAQSRRCSIPGCTPGRRRPSKGAKEPKRPASNLSPTNLRPGRPGTRRRAHKWPATRTSSPRSDRGEDRSGPRYRGNGDDAADRLSAGKASWTYTADEAIVAGDAAQLPREATRTTPRSGSPSPGSTSNSSPITRRIWWLEPRRSRAAPDRRDDRIDPGRLHLHDHADRGDRRSRQRDLQVRRRRDRLPLRPGRGQHDDDPLEPGPAATPTG